MDKNKQIKEMPERLTKRFLGSNAPYTEFADYNDILNRLCDLEDKIEQGKIVELPLEIKRAMMITVGCRNWKSFKMILVPTTGEYGRRLDEIAKEAFEKYKATQQDEEIYMFNYCYHGNVEILTT